MVEGHFPTIKDHCEKIYNNRKMEAKIEKLSKLWCIYLVEYFGTIKNYNNKVVILTWKNS